MPKTVRETEFSIQIDAAKDKYPFVHFERDEDGSLIVVIDGNEGGQIVGEGTNLAIIRIGRKKARRLREFLERTEYEF